MKQRVLFFLCALIGCVGFAAAQAKTVTNADLDKFKQRRLQAEQDLKEYYAKIGLSEGDVLKKQAEDAKAREDLTSRLRASRLEQERIDAESRRLAADSVGAPVTVVVDAQGNSYPGYYTYSAPYYRRGGRWYRPSRYPITYRATPMGIIYEPGNRPASIYSPLIPQRPQPAWRTVRRPR